MSSPIISVKNIGKKYKLGATLGGRNYKTLRDTIANGVKRIVQSVRRAGHGAKGIVGSGESPNNQNATHNAPCAVLSESNSRSAPCPLPSAEASPHEFWALKDISFDVQQGEVVGIIGANGAGKSTLLKILCGITEPTEGEIHIRGRIASLLEVGTGFHPELSGRENIFMNGAILGMTKSEIQVKFDEIVAFAEVERFIDTPVKRYSSGMYVRLAFAVAAHLEPEILLVDEVLAVGDAAFQKKCLGKMEDVSRLGRTILFVSHNMNAVNRLCPRSILVNDGRISDDGLTPDIQAKYLSLNSHNGEFTRNDFSNRQIQIMRLSFNTSDGQVIDSDYDISKHFILNLRIFLPKAVLDGYITISVRDMFGTVVLFSDIRDSCEQGLSNGYSHYRVEFPAYLFASGEYYFTVAVSSLSLGILDVVKNVLKMRIRDFCSARGEQRLGYFGIKLKWLKHS